MGEFFFFSAIYTNIVYQAAIKNISNPANVVYLDAVCMLQN